MPPSPNVKGEGDTVFRFFVHLYTPGLDKFGDRHISYLVQGCNTTVKRCYFRVTKFSAFGSTKTYSRVVKFALSRFSLVILVLQIFSRVFEFALAEFARNTRKLMYREYFHFYSMC